MQLHFGIHLVNGFDILASKYVGGPAIGIDPSVTHQNHTVRISGSNVKVVTDHDDQDLSVPGVRFQEAHHVHLVFHVEVRRGLVQYQDIRFLDQSAGDEYSLHLSRAELADVAVAELLEFHQFYRRINHVDVPFGGSPSCPRMPSQKDGLGDGHAEHAAGTVGDECEYAGDVQEGHGVDVHPVDLHTSRVGFEQFVYALYEGGLSDTVGTENAHESRFVECEVDVVQDLLRIVSEAHVLELDADFFRSFPGSKEDGGIAVHAQEEIERQKKIDFEKAKDKELIDSILEKERALDEIDKAEKLKRKQEFIQNKKYLEYVLNQKKEAEAWMDKLAQDEADKAYQKEKEEWLKEEAKRIQLLKDVYKDRERAVLYHKQLREDEKVQILKEREILDEEIRKYNQMIEEINRQEALRRKTHQGELKYQINEKDNMRRKEQQDKLYEERAAQLWEMEYQKKIDQQKALHLQRLAQIKARNNPQFNNNNTYA